MSSSAAVETEAEAADLVCELDSVQGIVDALTSVRWKRHQVIILFLLRLSSFSLLFLFQYIILTVNKKSISLKSGRSRRII